MMTLLNRKEKKGLSDIVATVLIVLLALAAVAIIWTFIRPMITNIGGQSEWQAKCIASEAKVSKCSVNVTTNMSDVTVQLARGDQLKVKAIVEGPTGLTNVSDSSTKLTGLNVAPFKTGVPTNAVIMKTTDRVTAKGVVIVTDTNGADATCDPEPTPFVCTMSI